MGTAEVVASGLGLILAALLIFSIGQSLRAAFGRPGPSAPAMAAYSLSVGRGMMLVTALGLSLFSTRLDDLTGSAGTAVGVVGTAAVALLMAAETRWPRQSGTIRVARLGRPSIRQSVEARYLVGLGITAAFFAGSAVFFLLVDPTVRSAPSSSALLVALGSLVVMAALAGLALRQLQYRPVLAGVGADVDGQLRAISVRRIIRALMTAGLIAVAAMSTDLQGAMTSRTTEVEALPRALSTFLFLVQIGCLLGAIGLYQVGPTRRTMQKSGLLVASTRR